MKSVFKKGYWYALGTSLLFYVSENKSLAGKEDRNYDGEAFGRKLAVTFFERAAANLVQPVDRGGALGLKPQLLTAAEILLSGGFALPSDPRRSAAETEVLAEAQYERLKVQRFAGTSATGASVGSQMYALDEETLAEEALVIETPPHQRTKMMLARCVLRHEAIEDRENLQSLWALSQGTLTQRALPFLPAPPPAASEGKGRGRGTGKARGKGRASGG